MIPTLSSVEIRILGCLLEKETTTPEYYPLTLNALTNACNQKSSRDPVMDLDQTAVIRGLLSLKEKRFVYERHEEGSRTAKYVHAIENLLRASTEERAVLCLLFLRGPQTPGEIKTRGERLASFASPADVEAVLQELAARADGPFVQKLARQPGQKEARYGHLFGKETTSEAIAEPATVDPTHPTVTSPTEVRLAALEKKVAALEEQLCAFRSANSSSAPTQQN